MINVHVIVFLVHREFRNSLVVVVGGGGGGGGGGAAAAVALPPPPSPPPAVCCCCLFCFYFHCQLRNVYTGTVLRGRQLGWTQ